MEEEHAGHLGGERALGLPEDAFEQNFGDVDGVAWRESDRVIAELYRDAMRLVRFEQVPGEAPLFTWEDGTTETGGYEGSREFEPSALLYAAHGVWRERVDPAPPETDVGMAQEAAYTTDRRWRSGRTNQCIQRIGTSGVQVRACGTTLSQKLRYEQLSGGCWMSGTDQVCVFEIRIKFRENGKCMVQSGSSVIQGDCSTASSRVWITADFHRFQAKSRPGYWLANESAGGAVYLLQQSNPYNNNRTAWSIISGG